MYSFFFVLWFVCLNSLFAGEVSFVIPTNTLREVNPGAAVTTMAVFDNTNDEERSVEVSVKTEEKDWRLLSDFSNVVIAPKSTVRKVVGIHIPNGQKAGEVKITLEAIDKKSGAVVGTATLLFNVRARYGLELEKIKAPEILYSGDTSSVVYIIRNTSNVDVTVVHKVSDESTTKTEEFLLKKESMRFLTYEVKIPKNADSYGTRSIFINAEIKDKQDTRTTFFTSVDYFGTGKDKNDPYIRFPIRISAVGAYTSAYGKGYFSNMYDIGGMGYFGKLEKRQKIEFKIRGPNRNENPLFGLNNEYYARYSSNSLSVTAGDYRFGLSNLTESSRSGRGLGISYKVKKLSFGGFYSIPRYYPLIKKTLSGFALYEWRNSNSILAGFISKTDTLNNQTPLMTIAAKNCILPWLRTDIEASIGKFDGHLYKAYKTAVLVNTKLFSTNVDYTYADVGFPGFISNTEMLNGSLSLNIKKINISINYNRNSTNQALDTFYSKPPITESYSVNTGFQITKHNSISFGGVASSTKENAANPFYNYQRYNGRASLRNQYKHFNVNIDADFGKIRNNLNNSDKELNNFFTGNLTSGCSISNIFSTNVFMSYQLGQKGITGGETVYYGATLMANIKERISLSLQYNSNFEWTYYTSDRSLLSMNLSAEINSNNRFVFSSNYNLVKNSLNNKTYNAQLSYIYTLNMPVAKRKDIGNLKGRIINKGVEKVSGVRLSLAGRMAITDKEGNFSFNAVPVGSQLLGVDPASFGLHTVAETSGPYNVEIIPSQTTSIEIAMTKAARIEGAIEVEEDERANQKGYIAIKEGIERLVIEASTKNDIFRVLTDANGLFRFEDLRPGDWQIKVYPNGLPKGYQLLNQLFNVTLTPGGNEKIIVKVQKKARQIQFQQSVKNK